MPTAKPFLTWTDSCDTETAIGVRAHTVLQAARLYAEQTYDLKRGSGGVDVLVRDEIATWVVHVGIDVEVTFAPARPGRILESPRRAPPARRLRHALPAHRRTAPGE